MATSVKESIMIGAVAQCQHGKKGVICSIDMERTDSEKRVLYKGISFDGTAWQSVNPVILATCLNDYIHRFILNKEQLEVSI